jgi:hypothetical protein
MKEMPEFCASSAHAAGDGFSPDKCHPPLDGSKKSASIETSVASGFGPGPGKFPHDKKEGFS